MLKKISLIYIPGLGDDKSRGQDKVIQLFRLWGMRVTYFPVNWGYPGDFESRFNELLVKIDQLSANGRTVALIGASAGASAVLNAFAARKEKVARVVLICGKVDHLDHINASYYSQNPRFKGSVDLLGKSLDNLDQDNRRKILSLRPYVDPVVPPADTIIGGATNKRVLSIGHSTTIAYCLTVGMFRIASWIRKG